MNSPGGWGGGGGNLPGGIWPGGNSPGGGANLPEEFDWREFTGGN